MQKKILTIILLLLSPTLFAQKKTTFEFPLDEATIDSVHQAIQNNQLSCEALVNNYLDRIKQYNLSVAHQAPINAITYLNPYALAQARQLDASYAKTHQLAGPLHCIPVILKDNIDSFDTNSSAGSYALLGNHPNHDAFLTARLRKAGAIIFAKGAMDELASGLTGMSSLSGRVGNAYDANKNPGGSSSGPAAAVSANFSMVGIGSDNSGSIRIPAAFNGLIGLRPSTGIISQTGVFPLGKLDGVAGPLTRTTKDLAIIMDVIATQEDPQDPKTQNIPRLKNYTDLLSQDALKNKRIGIVHFVGNYDVYQNMPDKVKKTIQQAEKHLQQAGAVLIDNINLPKFNSDRHSGMAGSVEAVNQYLASYPAVRKNMADLCLSDRTRTYGKTPQDCLKFIQDIPSKNSKEYKKILAMFEQNRDYVESIMQQQKLDALLLPISQSGDATYDQSLINTGQAPVSSNSGMPAITINAGYLNGMPIGIELDGKIYSDGELIAMAYAYEQQTGPRHKPAMPETNPKLMGYSIAQLNNLFPALGKAAYDQVLKNEDKENLTPERFKKITEEVIRKQ
jgi:aspartyl-tRNA(Asn)/glutamyl-tRNA(Gln) amidotransferase subunit A